MSAAGSEADVSVTTEKPGKQLPWSPPSRDEFTARLEEVLTSTEDLQYRLNVGLQCWALMNRAWYRRTNAARFRTQWNWFRYAAAVIPVVAAGAGGSLLGQLHGSAATTVGWVALAGGLIGAAINAVRPAVEYGVDLIKTAEFERLYWDVFNYAIVELPASDATAIPVKMNSFSERMREISVMSGNSTATSS